MEYINEDICRIRNGIFPSNTYLLKCSNDLDCIVIDPGLDTAKLEQEIDASGWKPVAIIATHGHFDHIGSVAMLKQKYNPPFYLHEADYKISQSANFYLKMARIDAKVITVKPDHLFKGETNTVSFGDVALTIHLLPGHSAGSCVIQYQHFLFSGDLIFLDGIGDDSIPRADTNALKQSLLKLIHNFPDSTIMVPGHGNIASLAAIKAGNKALQHILLKPENTNA